MLKRILGNTTLRYARRFSNLVMSHRFELACRSARAELAEYFPLVSRYLRAQIDDGGANHHFGSYKLLELNRLLCETMPRTIIEFGSGSTTAMFADYAQRNPDCRIISVDECEAYQEDVFRRLHKVGFTNIGQLQRCHCEKLIETRDDRDVTRYTPRYLSLLNDNAVDVDFVYVDGPTTNHPDKPNLVLPCVDAVCLCESGKFPAMIAFDFRIASVRYFLASAFQRCYTKELYFGVRPPENEPWSIDDVRYHSEFRRRPGYERFLSRNPTL